MSTSSSSSGAIVYRSDKTILDCADALDGGDDDDT